MAAALVRLFILLTIIASFALAGAIESSCPTACSCRQHPTGLYIQCSGANANIDAIFTSLGTRHVQRLVIRNAGLTKLKSLPRASVRSLHLISCGITSIEHNAFAGLADELEELVLSSNSLGSVPLLGSLPRLLSLTLDDNLLTDISEGSLEGAPILKHLRADRNRICTLSRNALNENKGTLESLALSGNCLGRVPAQNIRNCIRLTYLDLSFNKIADVAKFEIMNLPELKELRMDNNLLASISPMAFMNVPQLQYLYLNNNLLESLQSSRLFQVLKQLQALDLSHNRLAKIPSSKELSNIRQIRLDSNRITHIETLAFSSNSRLQLINLQNNRISSISRNSFDALEQLSILLLANNSIKALERGMLDGMKSLQQLNLRNNSLSQLSNSSFTSVPSLTTLDLAHNAITHIDTSAFAPLSKLFWLDLSANRLSNFDKDTFKHRIANILLDGNALHCDDKLDWLVEYLVLNQVRTFLPYQRDVTCSSPQKLRGVRLKELMINKANQTIIQHKLNSQAQAPPNNVAQGLLNNFLPAGMRNMIPNLKYPILTNPASNAQLSKTADPNLNPGMQAGAGKVPQMNDIADQVSAPLQRLSSGAQPLPSDIEQLLKLVPNLIVNVPGMGAIDIAKLPPPVISHVLRGGQIPGMPKEQLDQIVSQLMQKIRALAQGAHASRTSNMVVAAPSADGSAQVTAGFINAPTIVPYHQHSNMAEYFTARLPLVTANIDSSNGSKSVALTKFGIAPELVEMLKMLPPGYDIGKIPKEVMDAVGRGEMPNFALLPSDLQHYFVANSHRLFSSFSSKPNITVEEILRNLPKFERPIRPTFSPYDLNEINSELTGNEADEDKHERMHYYTAILLGLVGAISVSVLSLLCIYMRRQHLTTLAMDLDEDSLVNHPRLASSPRQATNHTTSSSTARRNLPGSPKLHTVS